MALKFVGHAGRICMRGRRNQGDDGAYWDEKRGLVIVADGLGSVRGKGEVDIARVLKKLPEKTRLAQWHVREAILDSCHPEEGKSALVVGLFPRLGRRGRLYLRQAGDCMAVRVDRNEPSLRLERLLPEASMLGRYIIPSIPELSSVTCADDLEGHDVDDLVKRIQDLIARELTDPDHPDHRDTRKWARDYLSGRPSRYMIFRFMRKMRVMMRGSLNGRPDEQACWMNEERVSLAPGQRYLFCTDGTFPDILTPRELFPALHVPQTPELAVLSIHAAIRAKVDYYSGPKPDDAGIVVVDVLDA